MIDQAYRKINAALDQKVYEETRAFHAKTNNFLLPGALCVATSEDAKQKLIQEIEYTDIPISPFDSKRVLCPMDGAPLFPQRQKSAEEFLNPPIAAAALFQLLQNAFGESQVNQRSLRPYPSGGALYSVQVIVGIRGGRFSCEPHSEPLRTGFYHYRPSLNALDPLASLEDAQLVDLTLNDDQRPLGHFNFCLIYVSFLAKAMFKYSHRGYRLSLLEAGSMYQQAGLCAQSLGLRERVWSYFEDQRLCKVIGLNPVCYFPLIAQLFGVSDV
ncbi:MAG: SagB/ThcOx family dehydrogenase [Holosporales bacterium]|nr:SagB/ThcOx family dehydrogenase [Holosporales bacterium]